MILRLDRVAVELPRPSAPSPNSASAVQELLGGKFGEMSTLMNYTFQSFNFRGRNKFRPFYDLIANIAAEEYSHIELVSYTINLLLTGSAPRSADPVDAPLEPGIDARNTYHVVRCPLCQSIDVRVATIDGVSPSVDAIAVRSNSPSSALKRRDRRTRDRSSSTRIQSRLHRDLS